jgi:hypothetical protein
MEQAVQLSTHAHHIMKRMPQTPKKHESIATRKANVKAAIYKRAIAQAATIYRSAVMHTGSTRQKNAPVVGLGGS